MNIVRIKIKKNTRIFTSIEMICFRSNRIDLLKKPFLPKTPKKIFKNDLKWVMLEKIQKIATWKWSTCLVPCKCTFILFSSSYGTEQLDGSFLMRNAITRLVIELIFRLEIFLFSFWVEFKSIFRNYSNCFVENLEKYPICLH